MKASGPQLEIWVGPGIYSISGTLHIILSRFSAEGVTLGTKKPNSRERVPADVLEIAIKTCHDGNKPSVDLGP